MKYKIFCLLTVILLQSSNNKLVAQEEKFIGLFIYNFTKYFDWPESNKSGDFVIEILGHESVYRELVKLTNGKKVGNQDFVIKNFSSVEGIGKCSIVFVGHWHSRFLPEVLNKVSDSPTLVITEFDGLLQKGSCINFVIQEGTIKFEMNSTNVQKRQLKTDPRIRELALKVVD
jgi:predicted nuclease of restriction endonuclease-like RecB superfamily